jgi:hypothetical protein
VHEGVEALVGVFMPFVGEVSIDHGGCELGLSQVALDETRIDAGFTQMGGICMSEGMDGATCCGDAGSLSGGTEGTLDTGATHGGGRWRTLGVIPPGGGKEPGLVPMGFPGGAEQRESRGGQGNVAVFGARAAVDMALEALAIDVRDLQGEGFMEPEAQAVDGGKGDLVVQGGRGTPGAAGPPPH